MRLTQVSVKVSIYYARVFRILEKLSRHLILAFFTIVVVYPVVWMVLASFRTRSEIFADVWGLPRSLSFGLQNYSQAWVNAMLGRAMLNSVIVSMGTVALIVIAAGLAGYALAKIRFRFATLIFLVFLLTLQTPLPVIPLYLLLSRMHLTNNFGGLILPMVARGLPMSIFIFRSFFQSVPNELLDAAKVDGCSDFTAFLRIVVPISGPVIATVSILEFVISWNEFFVPLMVVHSPEMRTIPLAVQQFFYFWGRVQWEQVFAALTIGSIPMIIIYVIMQRRFIEGLTAGALKG